MEMPVKIKEERSESLSVESGHELEVKDGTSSPQEGEENLTPITEVNIKEEPCNPSSENLLLITKKEENNLEDDTSCIKTENNPDRSCEDQTRSSKVLTPSKCQECKRIFSTVSELLQHQEVHIVGKKRLQCPVCFRVFAHASNLSRHKYVHTGIKNFVCKFCNKKFSQKSNLAQHETIHTGERPYSCQYCTRTFTWESNLNQHIQAHHHNKPDSCVVSDTKFPKEEKFP